MKSSFRDEHPLERRKAEADRILQKYADRIPVHFPLFLLFLLLSLLWPLLTSR